MRLPPLRDVLRVELLPDLRGRDPARPYRHSGPPPVQHFDIHPNQITQWKSQLLAGCGKTREPGYFVNHG